MSTPRWHQDVVGLQNPRLYQLPTTLLAILVVLDPSSKQRLHPESLISPQNAPQDDCQISSHTLNASIAPSPHAQDPVASLEEEVHGLEPVSRDGLGDEDEVNLHEDEEDDEEVNQGDDEEGDECSSRPHQCQAMPAWLLKAFKARLAESPLKRHLNNIVQLDVIMLSEWNGGKAVL
ncbi:hypothetical protein CPB84DRAFT_1751552 [Gymnopilus junonius]|uniref:Uncharacterized protein n=1 Tax=Gymnopilus junonius TaxID=109634 RepID=A0A9P5NF08_GYMJU|nr:hypothetical protein CPB84DRAFT_1751552 [Gymnopilus junonius]